MVAIIPNAIIEGDSLAAGPQKKARASKTQVDTEMSRALLALPEWMHTTVLSVIVPSLIKFYGARDYPWDVDGKSKTDLKNLLDSLLRRLHPQRHHDVTRHDKIWRFVSTVPHSIVPRSDQTLRHVKHSLTGKRGSRRSQTVWSGPVPKEQPQLQSPSGPRTRLPKVAKPFIVCPISRWALLLMLACPPSDHICACQNHQEARGAMHSKYIVQLLSYHFEATEGAIIDTGPPVGALALAAVAVSRSSMGRRFSLG